MTQPRPVSVFVWLILPLLLVCGAVSSARPGAWGPRHQIDLLTHAVYAYRQWQSTGVTLNAGDLFTIRAEGEWEYSPFVGFHSARGGRPAPSYYPLPQVPGGALIGRIGEAGNPFYVGPRLTNSASSAGLLYLRINDDLLGDNAGQLKLEIRVVVVPTPENSAGLRSP
jgi:hypothetical protein